MDDDDQTNGDNVEKVDETLADQDVDPAEKAGLADESEDSSDDVEE